MKYELGDPIVLSLLAACSKQKLTDPCPFTIVEMGIERDGGEIHRIECLACNKTSIYHQLQLKSHPIIDKLKNLNEI